MLLILIITYFICNTTAKLQAIEEKQNNLDDVESNRYVEYIIGDPLWVLHLSTEEWFDAKLILGTFEEQEDFYNAVEPLNITASIKQPAPRAKKDDPENPKRMPQVPASNRTNVELKKDIMMLINKFAFAISVEPDAYITEDNNQNNASIALYFKGPVSCLLVKQGTKEWHYVLKAMIFPEWFYESHDTFNSPLAIPDEIKNSFYSKLLRLLQIALWHPI